MLKPKNGRTALDGAAMDWVRFGTGARTLVMIPGLSDGLRTVRGLAWPMALLYRSLAKDFTVYMFSRREPLEAGADTRGMAADLARVLTALGVKRAAVVGVSMGGMVAQWLAVDHPEVVERLVLTVTLCRPNATELEALGVWTDLARKGDYAGVMRDTAERTYTPAKLRRERLSLALAGCFGKPRSLDRFLIQAEACGAHDCQAELSRVSCPTLVIGGTEDRIVTGEASAEIAERIPGSELRMVEGMGHGLYEECPDFLRWVADFCR